MVLEGNQFTEQNGYIPSREYLKIDGNIYGFYSRGYAIGSEHGHYYTSEAIAAAGGYRDALLWSSIFVTLVAKKYHESVTLPSGLRMVYDNH